MSDEIIIPDWVNCAIIGKNKEPAHCTLTPFPSLERASKPREESSLFKSLRLTPLFFHNINVSPFQSLFFFFLIQGFLIEHP